MNAAHPEGASKARFFLRFGFDRSTPNALAFALLTHARPETFVRETVSHTGDVKYVYEGPLPTPDGRVPRVRTVWRIDAERVAHFVTAVPLTR